MDANLYKDMFDLEMNHWWFLARRRILLDQINRMLGNRKYNKILDAGCGTGGILQFLEKYGDVYGIDVSPEAVRFCHQRGYRIVQGSLTEELPFEESSFDIITAFDVLEHLSDDTGAIKSTYNLLRKGGFFFCTVPAYSFLWSNHDVIHHHYRRYTHCELKAKLITAGFNVKKLSYYNTFLFPVIASFRIIKRLLRRVDYSDIRKPPYIINILLTHLFASERFLLRYIDFPFGISILAIAEKA